MHAEATGTEFERDAQPDASGDEAVPAPGRRGHSLLDVLMPATPPQPKNARVVRLFDYEAGRSDAGGAPPPAEPVREPTARETARAARRLSLSIAAGLP